ncbi:phage tail tip lysozyme [Nocardia nova]|uniref:phage tail tip lysozyme n=1 Tax=Nocardia nova TaxID=37330 RepID=UPI0033D6C75F
MLGSGTPSKAPDLQKLLSRNGVSHAKDESTMVDNYKAYKTKIHDATSGIDRQDKGIAVKTSGIGDAVTKAYSAVDSSVGDLNTKIDASFKTVKTVVVETKDGQKTTKQELPAKIVDGLFNAVWETLTTTYTSVSDVSDQAAKQALEIRRNPPGSPPPAGPAPVPTSSGGGGFPSFPSGGVSPASYNPSDGPAPDIPEGQKPTAKAIYDYLIEKGFTPAQAAGIIGNMQIESGFRTDAYNSGEGAIGLCQWEGGRRSKLEAFAGNKVGNWKTQVDFMVHEMQTSETGAYARVKASKTPGEAAAAFDQYYERSSGEARGKRISAAENFANSMTVQAV